jgi:hypothetical protein
MGCASSKSYRENDYADPSSRPARMYIDPDAKDSHRANHEERRAGHRRQRHIPAVMAAIRSVNGPKRVELPPFRSVLAIMGCTASKTFNDDSCNAQNHKWNDTASGRRIISSPNRRHRGGNAAMMGKNAAMMTAVGSGAACGTASGSGMSGGIGGC